MMPKQKRVFCRIAGKPAECPVTERDGVVLGFLCDICSKYYNMKKERGYR